MFLPNIPCYLHMHIKVNGTEERYGKNHYFIFTEDIANGNRSRLLPCFCASSFDHSTVCPCSVPGRQTPISRLHMNQLGSCWILILISQVWEWCLLVCVSQCPLLSQLCYKDRGGHQPLDSAYPSPSCCSTAVVGGVSHTWLNKIISFSISWLLYTGNEVNLLTDT